MNQRTQVLTMMPNVRSVELVRGRGGYGFTLSGQEPCIIRWIARSSSGESAGLQKGDAIVSVNGENVFDASHEHVAKLIGMSADVLHLEIQEGSGSILLSSDDEDLRMTRYSEVNHKRRVMHKPPHRAQQNPVREEGHEYNRTEQVLNELKNGTLIQSMLSALDANPYDRESSTASSRSSHGSRTKPKKHKSRDRGNKSNHSAKSSAQSAKTRQQPSHRRNRSLPMENILKGNYNANSSNIVFSNSVVAYLGTNEILIEDQDDIPHACLAAIESCVQQLRREQHIHQRVVLKIFQSSIKLFNADGDVLAVYDGQQLCFSSCCPDDDRFFCIATLHGEDQVRCHHFMVDPEMCAHRNHAEKAKRFGIHCSTDSETGNCIEFPRSPRIILRMVEALFDSQQMAPAPNSEAPRNPVIQGLETGDMSGNSVTTTDSGVDGMNGSVVRMQNHIQQYITNKSKKDVQTVGSKLSQKNLKRHDMNSSDHGSAHDANFNRYMATTGELPPIMQRIPAGKYKGGAGTLPLQRSLVSVNNSIQDSKTQDVRRSKRGKKGSKNGEGLFFRVPKRSSSRQLKLNMKNMMSKSSESIPLSEAGHLSGASSIESLSSNASLPSCFNGSGITSLENGGRVSIWAISFDRLLEDTMGVKYFTEFLRKEFSQENILFWLECETLRKIPATDTSALKELADSIYERFLSAQATSPVNIDSKGQRLSEEALTKPPHPDMFELQQNQIYKLMKLDSYSRFLKSPLYRQCVMCQVEGVPLPLEPDAHKDSNETQIESRHSFSLKHRRFFPRKARKSQGSNDSIHRDSSDSESGFQEAMTNSNRQDDLSTMHQVGVDASLICRLVLWDGSSTVLYAEEGKATIREALNALCERRGVPLSAVDIYYQNEDRALALNQDVAVLAGQEVRVERRTLFRLDLLPIGRSVGVKAKPSKTTEEVLKPVVAKYGLEFENLQTRLSGEKDLLDLSKTVNVLDGLRVSVDYPSEKSQDSGKGTLRKSKSKSEQKSKENKSLPGHHDTEDLINIMSTAQNGKMHDQRGLLSEMNLELPDFLKTPTPSPAKKPITATNNSNSNNNNGKENLDLNLPSGGNGGYPLDVPMPKGGGRLSPNPVGTGNARARIQKLKHHVGETKSTPSTPAESNPFRQKIPSLDIDVSAVEPCDSDTLSAVDDDPFVITKWMQSVSCTPKYPYSTNLDNTFGLASPVVSNLNATSRDLVFDYENDDTNGQSSVAHDHRYTKRKEKVRES